MEVSHARAGQVVARDDGLSEIQDVRERAAHVAAAHADGISQRCDIRERVPQQGAKVSGQNPRRAASKHGKSQARFLGLLRAELAGIAIRPEDGDDPDIEAQRAQGADLPQDEGVIDGGVAAYEIAEARWGIRVGNRIRQDSLSRSERTTSGRWLMLDGRSWPDVSPSTIDSGLREANRGKALTLILRSGPGTYVRLVGTAAHACRTRHDTANRADREARAWGPLTQEALLRLDQVRLRLRVLVPVLLALPTQPE